MHVLHVDRDTLRELPTPHAHERVGERLNRFIENPQEYERVGRKPIAVVTNPDIFYYALYFAAYNRLDRRNLFERFLLRFDYVVIDEFHYYSPKQLACFLFFFALCKEWGYFEHGRRICLLSATPVRCTPFSRPFFGQNKLGFGATPWIFSLASLEGSAFIHRTPPLAYGSPALDGAAPRYKT
jgi:CRISPR-associated helicase Cas3